jgi:hypothetical protein
MNKLPNDMLVSILLLLNDKDKVSIARTCKRLKKICEDTERLWEKDAKFSGTLHRGVKRKWIENLEAGSGRGIFSSMVITIEELPKLQSLKLDFESHMDRDPKKHSSYLYIFLQKKIKKLELRVDILFDSVLIKLLKKYNLEELIIRYNETNSEYYKIIIKEIRESYKKIILVRGYDTIIPQIKCEGDELVLKYNDKHVKILREALEGRKYVEMA